MSVSDAGKYLLPVSLTGVLLFLIGYLLLQPDKVAIWAGWLWTGIARIWRGADRKAVAYRVQGEVNSGRAALLKHAPPELLEGKLKLKWRDVDEARAVVDQGEVLVFMRRADHHAENVAHALVAYLPKALIPRARRYIEPQTMKAADLTVAKAVLSHDDAARGALDVFYDRHLDPAAAGDEEMQRKLVEMDEIDLHGWLVRMVLVEFRLLGNRLYPGRCDVRCLAESESFARWLGEIASLGRGETAQSLVFRGEYYRVAIIFVAQRETLAEKGTHPYRQRAKRYLYKDRFDAVYLMARDPNIWAVEELVKDLSSDARIADTSCHRYHLRSDFAARKGLTESTRSLLASAAGSRPRRTSRATPRPPASSRPFRKRCSPRRAGTTRSTCR